MTGYTPKTLRALARAQPRPWWDRELAERLDAHAAAWEQRERQYVTHDEFCANVISGQRLKLTEARWLLENAWMPGWGGDAYKEWENRRTAWLAETRET